MKQNQIDRNRKPETEADINSTWTQTKISYCMEQKKGENIVTNHLNSCG